MLTRRLLLLSLASFGFAHSGRVFAAPQVEFHYFGAVDCPICATFRAADLAELRQRAEAAGMTFIARETASLRDLRKAGVFDELNALWRKVVQRSGDGVPAFALVDGGKFIDSRAGEWRDLLVLAIARAAKKKGGSS